MLKQKPGRRKLGLNDEIQSKLISCPLQPRLMKFKACRAVCLPGKGAASVSSATKKTKVKQ